MSRNRAAYALYIELEMQLEKRQPRRGHEMAALVASGPAHVDCWISCTRRGRKGPASTRIFSRVSSD